MAIRTTILVLALTLIGCVRTRTVTEYIDRPVVVKEAVPVIYRPDSLAILSIINEYEDHKLTCCNINTTDELEIARTTKQELIWRKQFINRIIRFLSSYLTDASTRVEGYRYKFDGCNWTYCIDAGCEVTYTTSMWCNYNEEEPNAGDYYWSR